MKELKSKKTGTVQIVTEEEYAQITRRPELLKKFTVTDLRARPVVSPAVPNVKSKIKKNEG